MYGIFHACTQNTKRAACSINTGLYGQTGVLAHRYYAVCSSKHNTHIILVTFNIINDKEINWNYIPTLKQHFLSNLQVLLLRKLKII